MQSGTRRALSMQIPGRVSGQCLLKTQALGATRGLGVLSSQEARWPDSGEGGVEPGIGFKGFSVYFKGPHLQQVREVVRDLAAHDGDVDLASAHRLAAAPRVLHLQLDRHLRVLPLEALCADAEAKSW